MAQRRMFSLKVIDTDLFLEMPATSQLLYFHLAMRADDDGFIGSPNKIRKIVNSSEDDLKLLIAKQFIIPFESGICVIKHWRIHNYIQKDRYNPSFYKNEKEMLVDDNGVYENKNDINTKCIQDGYKTDTQARLGKARLGKARLELLLPEIQRITSSDENQAAVILKAAVESNKDIDPIIFIKEKWDIIKNGNYKKPYGALIKALREDWSKPTSNNKGQNFNNFTGRVYNYDELEKKLLGYDDDDEEEEDNE